MTSVFKRKPIDWVFLIWPTVLFVLTVCFAVSDISEIWWFVSLPLQAIVISNVRNSSLHWHSHQPIFSRPWVNRLYEFFLTLSAGKTFTSWKALHMMHHRVVSDNPTNGQYIDLMSCYKGSRNGQRANIWPWLWNNSWPPVAQWFEYKSFLFHPDLAKKHMVEMWVFKIYVLLLFLVNPAYAMFHLLLMFAGYVVDAGQAYSEHWLSLDHTQDNSRNASCFYNRWFNIWAFNGGYHQEHHLSPGTHWTELPELTKQLPNDRVQLDSPALVNLPLWQDFKCLFRLSSSSRTD